MLLLFFPLSLWFYFTVQYNTSSYRQERGSILLAFKLASKTHFKLSPRKKKKEYHVTCFIYLLDIQRLPACFFRLPHWYHSLYFNWFFCLLCLWALVYQFSFCTLHLYMGMCNIIIMRTFAMVSFGVLGHWWLQCQGKWQYLQHACASFFLHLLSFKHSFTTGNTVPRSLNSVF